MISLGFLALGAFVGAIIGLFLLNSNNWDNPLTGLTAVLAAAVSGAPITLAQYIVGDTGLAPAMAMYPIGLVLGIMTPYLTYAAQNVTSEDKNWRRLGYAHFLAYLALVFFGVAIFIFPGWITGYFGLVDQYFIDARPEPK